MLYETSELCSSIYIKLISIINHKFVKSNRKHKKRKHIQRQMCFLRFYKAYLL
nr:MAG TPA: hypothetical protein [Caudoviricetes sp.]